MAASSSCHVSSALKSPYYSSSQSIHILNWLLSKCSGMRWCWAQWWCIELFYSIDANYSAEQKMKESFQPPDDQPSHHQPPLLCNDSDSYKALNSKSLSACLLRLPAPLLPVNWLLLLLVLRWPHCLMLPTRRVILADGLLEAVAHEHLRLQHAGRDKT